jgi:hypothetical protein
MKAKMPGRFGLHQPISIYGNGVTQSLASPGSAT